MCGLCGIFQGGDHWTDESTALSPQVRRTRRHERLHRVAITNKVLKFYGFKLSDWNGSSYILSSQTGQSQIIDNIAALWPAAEALRKRSLDPLDDKLIAALERA